MSEIDWDDEFNQPTMTEVVGVPGDNPALNHLLQLLDVGEVKFTREPCTVSDGKGGTVDVPGIQIIHVVITRRTDGNEFHAGAMMSEQTPPARFIVTLAHLLAQGVEKIKRG